MADHRHRTTARLTLAAVSRDDLDEHFALLSDPEVWRHVPSGRHTSREQTAAGLDVQMTSWERVGLGYWTARAREELSALVPAGSLVGVGGCAVREGTDWWNLYYRLARSAWGLGLATELAQEGMEAAHEAGPDRPVVAYLLEHNGGSRRVVERLGLSFLWRGPDAGNSDPGAVRLIYADRPLSPDMVERIAAMP